MHKLLFQSRISLRGSGTTPILQSLGSWLDLEQYSDVSFSLDVDDASAASGDVIVSYETSPTGDEDTFVAMATVSATAVAGTGPAISSVPLAWNPAVPLARFVRWNVVGTGPGTWDITFRIFAKVGKGALPFCPRSIAGCVLWLRADQGITLTGTKATGWDDQSLTGDTSKNLTQASSTNAPTFTAADSGFAGQPTLTFVPKQWLASTVWGAVLAKPATWYVVGSTVSTAGTKTFFDSLSAIFNRQRFGCTNDLRTPFLFAGATLTATNGAFARSVCCAVFNGDFGSFYQNSISNLVLAGKTGDGGQTGLTIGTDCTHGDDLNGTIAEIIAYAGEHTADQRATVMNYLGSRYGIVVTP